MTSKPDLIAAAAAKREEILIKIFERVAAGESIRAVIPDTGAPPEFPTRRTFWTWVARDAAVRQVYELALTARSDVYAEEIVAIADNVGHPLIDHETGEPVYLTDHATGERELVLVVTVDAVAHAKLRCDARKWVASRLLPKRYGDRTVIAGDPNAPIAIEFENQREILMRKLLPELSAALDGPVVDHDTGHASTRQLQ